MKLIEEISIFLQLPEEYIRKLAKSASYKYKEYTIDKRHGGKRTIYQPSKELKAVQRFLLYFVIKEFLVHDTVFSYRESLNIVDHAKKHKKNNYLLRMDLSDFFPSIKREDIINYFDTIKGKKKEFKDWESDDIDLFCKLVCKDECLTIGAPSSPALSNAICYEMDSELARLAQDNDVIYTRYADDLFFSTKVTNILKRIEKETIQIIKALKLPQNLKINKKKTRHSSKKGRRQVTGIILGSDEEIHLGRYRKREIRSLIYKLDELNPEKRRYLAGMIAFAKDVDPNFINDLILKYGSDKITEAINIKDLNVSTELDNK